MGIAEEDGNAAKCLQCSYMLPWREEGSLLHTYVHEDHHAAQNHNNHCMLHQVVSEQVQVVINTDTALIGRVLRELERR